MTNTAITLKLAMLLDRADKNILSPAEHRYSQGVVNGKGVQVFVRPDGSHYVRVLHVNHGMLTLSEAAAVIAA